MGFPIRRSLDQRLFAAPQGLSQRTTSFIASQRQGIHRTPLWHLIALMIDARHPQPASRRIRPAADTARKTFTQQHGSCAPRRFHAGAPNHAVPLHDVTYPHARSEDHAGTRSSLLSQPDSLDTLSRSRWWSRTGSNRRPHACKARALPTELRPLGMVGPHRPRRPSAPVHGGPGTTRTSDLTLIRGAL